MHDTCTSSILLALMNYCTFWQTSSNREIALLKSAVFKELYFIQEVDGIGLSGLKVHN
jgi:hypothetical protein